MTDGDGAADRLRALLAQATPETVPGGVLLWTGGPGLPDGRPDSPALSQPVWEGAYLQLENGAVPPGSDFDPPVVRPLPFIKAATRDIRPDDPVPIAIANYAATVVRPDILDGVRSAGANGTVDLPDRLADATETRRVFIATGLLHDQWGVDVPAHRGRGVQFLMDPEFHLVRPGDPLPDAVEVDLGAGQGFVPVRPGVPFGMRYAEGDQAQVAVRCRYGTDTYTARFALAISDRAAPPLPDETWTLAPPPTGGEPALTGRAWVFRAPGHADLVNPLIMVEGFPGGHACDYMYDLLNQNDMLRDLYVAGYDLVIVGLDDGMAPIQGNAPVLAECIRQARERTSRPLVVGGVSMGGLIGRYTLAQMEKAGQDHGTGVYLCVDSPHRGTYTSLGVQWFVHALKDHAPGLKGFAALLDAPSNQQLMIAWLHDGAVDESDLRKQWLADLEAVGHPSKPRKLAVACGRGDGQGNASAGSRTLEWSVPPLVEMAVNTLPGDAQHVVAGGSLFLAPAHDLPRIVSDGGVTGTAWETVPGSQNTYNAQAAGVAQSFGIGPVEHACDVTCGIPTVSALDIPMEDPFAAVADDAGPFDAHVCSPDNVEHLEMTPEVSDWIVKQLGPAAAEGPAGNGGTATTGGGRAFDPHASSFITDPYPTYARLRAIGPYVDVPQYQTRWFFSHDDCVAILTGTDTFRKAPPGGEPPELGALGVMQVFDPGIFSSDPPRHAKLRGHIEPVLRAAMAEAPDIAVQLAGKRIANARRTGGMELVADFALPVPAGVLFKLLGIPEDPLVDKQLLDWVTAIVRAHDETQPLTVRATGATCEMALHMYLEALVRQYRSRGGSGVIGALSRTCVDDPTDPSGLTVEDIHRSCFDFVIAGYLSTTFLLASGLRCLLEEPEQLAALRANRGTLIGNAIQEMLRFESPLQVVDRYAAYDTKIGDTPVARGQRVTAVIGAGNRDPDYFGSDAGMFRIDRANAREHLAFGDGIHRCIGAPLAQLVAPVAMNALLDLDGLRIVGLPQWQTDPYIRGMINLPLRLGRS